MKSKTKKRSVAVSKTGRDLAALEGRVDALESHPISEMIGQLNGQRSQIAALASRFNDLCSQVSTIANRQQAPASTEALFDALHAKLMHMDALFAAGRYNEGRALFDALHAKLMHMDALFAAGRYNEGRRALKGLLKQFVRKGA